MNNYIFLFFIVVFNINAQSLQINGQIQNSKNQFIQGATITINNENLDIINYCFSDENGKFLIKLEKTNNKFLTINVTYLGFTKNSKQIFINNSNNIL